jgi:hypothetical protein
MNLFVKNSTAEQRRGYALLWGKAVIDVDHCTFAVTAPAAFKFNVQLFVLFPPLEHAPDQIASLPLLTERVMAVPEVKDAWMLLPTATLIPAGLDATRSPLRPVAVTVKASVVTGGVAGFTVRGASADNVPALAKMVSPVDCVTEAVTTVKVAVASPASTVTLAGKVATGLLVDNVTV